MTQGLYIDPASMKALDINFKRFRKYVLEKAHRGLVKFGMLIVGRAQRIIEKNGSIATGALRGSGRTVEQPDGTVDAGFYMTYAYWVEYGRKASGKTPPVDEIYQWLVKKHINPDGKGSLDERRRRMAWAIATFMKTHDTKAKPFLKPAYEEYRNKIDEFMRRKVNEAVEAFKAK